MALPTTAKLAHAISGHKERACSHNTRIHIHGAGFDCVFQKFKNTSTHYYPFLISYVLRAPRIITTHPCEQYTFVSRFSPLSFSLRAPPSLS